MTLRRWTISASWNEVPDLRWIEWTIDASPDPDKGDVGKDVSVVEIAPVRERLGAARALLRGSYTSEARDKLDALLRELGEGEPDAE